MAKITSLWVVCAACGASSPNLVDIQTREAVAVFLVASGWHRVALPLPQLNNWLCHMCAQTPEESRVLAGLRR